MDELDFDVTDLREAPDADTDADADGWEPAGAGRPAHQPSALLLHPRRLQLSRRLRATLTGAAVLLVSALLLLSIPQAPSSLAALLHIPTPTAPPPLPVGADTLVLRHTVPWGELRLDGEPVRHLGTALVPPNTQGVQLPALTLARGRHTLSYSALPFPTLRCNISVPAAPGDTCPLVSRTADDALETFGLTRSVDLGATFALLPPAQQDALLSVVAAALAAQSPTATLAAGEPYLAADGKPAVASMPLVATLRYTLDTSSAIIGPAGPIGPAATDACRPLCADEHDQGDLSAWLVAARLALAWQYAPAAGQPFAGPVAPGAPSAVYVDVQVTWDGGWRVIPAPIGGQAECAAATAAAQIALAQQRLSGRFSCVPALDHPANGCLVTAQPLDAAGLPSGSDLALYYRFGLLFAGNAAARRGLPGLPAIAPAALALLPTV